MRLRELIESWERNTLGDASFKVNLLTVCTLLRSELPAHDAELAAIVRAKVVEEAVAEVLSYAGFDCETTRTQLICERLTRDAAEAVRKLASPSDRSALAAIRSEYEAMIPHDSECELDHDPDFLKPIPCSCGKSERERKNAEGK